MISDLSLKIRLITPYNERIAKDCTYISAVFCYVETNINF